jgi:hypothetical protein
VAAVLWTMGSAERRAVRLRGDHGAWRGDRPAPVVEYLPPGSRSGRWPPELTYRR